MAPVRGLKSYVKLAFGLFCGYIVWGWLFGSSDDDISRPKTIGRYDRAFGSRKPTFTRDEKRREAIVDAFKHAWRAYERDAFGDDEYHPITNKGSNFTGNIGGAGIGYMIIDALDTMMIMKQNGDKELGEMYQRAHNWIEHTLDFSLGGQVNTFETTIRLLGGLLAAYHLADRRHAPTYLSHAVDLADRLLPSFETPSGLPLTDSNLHTRQGRGDMPNGGLASTAEVTTLQLEFKYLSHLTGNPIYWTTVAKVDSYGECTALNSSNAHSPGHENNGRFRSSDVRLGSRGDSYYEYLLKQYIQTNFTEPPYREMYEDAMNSIHELLFKRTPIQNLLYTAELEPNSYTRSTEFDMRTWHVSPKQDHLVCFLGGSLMLGATEAWASVPPVLYNLPRANARRDWDNGKALIETCMETHNTATGLSPEIAVFYDKEKRAEVKESGREWYIKGGNSEHPLLDARYILRPETVESLFIAFRLSGDPIYRMYGWRIFQAIEKHCKIPESQGGGYVSIRNVDRVEGEKGWVDNMETFFLAETLKYLYLLFSESDVIPLRKYVFNTEAHPLPVFTPTKALLESVIIPRREK
ncbi:glycoside hydrolase family 47 protein [Tulasnella calospora MUT 4182]|uniref:alpha-1,2-Mannosidase n=1 Tax=Tulasnella calospora MUT 4182 TaxID=1051891 RepID=A0A0C3M7S7_9AGAM|nr:glycoside hydrolase family 47 protein [Tulasnella calospora MUT 4182]